MMTKHWFDSTVEFDIGDEIIDGEGNTSIVKDILYSFERDCIVYDLEGYADNAHAGITDDMFRRL